MPYLPQNTGVQKEVSVELVREKFLEKNGEWRKNTDNKMQTENKNTDIMESKSILRRLGSTKEKYGNTFSIASFKK